MEKKNQTSPGLGSFSFRAKPVQVDIANPDGSTNTTGKRKDSTKNDRK